ncbi:2-acylglycerol O-acyltransferase 2-like isoform X2 [Bacillus rossius redtenbacheri]|uniref:2-acylglycerol O-acyltransferase 2-like isoform X2 n=1 Tax=Bacillus rossius redtenbacheri TaxID=93214 RepID=UPI002FDCEF9C
MLSSALDRLCGGCWTILLLVCPVLGWTLLACMLADWLLCWPALLYLGWMWLDRNTPYRGGRRLEWTRRLGLWRRAGSYFPLELVKTAELPPDGNYLLVVCPHGVFCHGAFLAFCTEAVGVSQRFPGITFRPFTLNINFYSPFVREFLMALGFCSVSAASLENFLRDRRCGNNALCLVVGGASEALLSEPGTYRLVTRRRRGFAKLALSHGARLVPVLVFGETDLYDQVRRPWLARIQEQVKDLTGVSPVLPLGQGLLQDRFGLLPRRRPLTALVGAPMFVEAVADPTRSQVEALHAEFIKQLADLFETHKHQYLADAADDTHTTFV